MTRSPLLITAIGTPLDAEEQLYVPGLEQHLSDQASAGIDGILVAGSMGLMQMLRDDTYQRLVEQASKLWRGKGELLVGVGDASLARTRERIGIVSRFSIDGVVVVTPSFFRFSSQELIQYFRALANASPVPVYLYDLPARTGVEIDISVYEAVVSHPNIKGAKISGRLEFARQLIDRFGDRWRIIVAEPDRINSLLREGICQHLEGLFAIAPHWAKEIVLAAGREDWDRAARFQRQLSDLKVLLGQASSPFGAFTAMMNARGLTGTYHAAPSSKLAEAELANLLSQPILQELVNA